VSDFKPAPKWMQEMIDRGVHPDLIAWRAEDRRKKNRLWALINKDKKAAHKRAYRAKKKTKSTEVGVVIKSTYRPNWKEAPMYYCPELTYRGKV
jgi:hypothetical protein